MSRNIHTIKSKQLTDKLINKACVVPFKDYDILKGGWITNCCYDWLPVYTGNLLSDTIEEIINNPEKLRIQNNMKKSVFDDCTTFCTPLNLLLADKKFPNPIIPIENLDKELNRPTSVKFSYDDSCNLQCPSCRNELIYWDPLDLENQNSQQLVKVHNKAKELVAHLLDAGQVVTVRITGSGDAFASPLYWDYLLELAQNPHKNIRLHLITNGILMTEENLNKIKPLWSHIVRINVSVDAATEDTYKIVRKNGNFIKLKKNLDVLDRLISNNEFVNLKQWQTSFILQQANYLEIESYLEWQLTFKSKPEISITLLQKWAHLTNETFNTMAVWQNDHPDRNELIEIIKTPLLTHPQVRGNIFSLLNQ